MDHHLTPAQTAKRFGVSVKALRLYERHGLLQPLRTSNGSTGAAWRAYGPAQLTRLHQILALKRLGLSLSQIADLMVGEDAMGAILAVQERVLLQDSERIARALALLRKARTTLASGSALSIDDLANLTLETVMTYPTPREVNEVLTPFKQKHLTSEDDASLKEWLLDQQDLLDSGKKLMEEARALMTSGDTTSAAAMNFARRWIALGKQLTSGESPLTALKPKLVSTLDEARADPVAAQKLAALAFIETVVKNLKAQADADQGKG